MESVRIFFGTIDFWEVVSSFIFLIAIIDPFGNIPITIALQERGVKLTSRIVPGGEHNEASWEKQNPFFISTLLYGLED